MIEQGALEELFWLDAVNGKLFWATPPRTHPRLLGKEAGGPRGTHNGKRYWIIKIGGKAYKRGHLIYCMVHGRWPTPMLDHIDGNSCNDRPANLRAATATQNAWNHKKRKRRIKLPMGVRQNKSGSFSARITVHGKQLHLGAYDTPEEASSAYQDRRKDYYGTFA